MTNETKEIILKYLTGTLPNEVGENIPTIENVKEIKTNIDEYIHSISPKFPRFFRLDKTLKRDDYLIVSLYGYEEEFFPVATKNGMLVLDSNYNPVNFIEKFDDGTDLFKVHSFDKNDTGTGNITFIGGKFASDGSGTQELVSILTINNFILTNSDPIIINRFDDVTTTFYQPNIFVKNAAGDDFTFNEGNNIIHYVANIGSELQRDVFTNNISNMIVNDIKVVNDTEYSFELLGNNSTSIIVGTSVLENFVINLSATYNYPSEVGNLNAVNAKYFNDDIIYSADSLISSVEKKLILIKIDTTQNMSIIVINDTYTVSAPSNLFIYYNFNFIGGILNVYLRVYEVQFEGPNTNPIKSDIYLYQYYNDQIYKNLVYTYGEIELGDSNFTVNTINNFNLSNIGYIFENSILQIMQVFNPLNYNGLPFINKNSLFPVTGRLKNGDITVFDRNLSNKVLNGNTTQSSIEIPNTLLNNETITVEQLMSFNRNIITNNTTEFTTNIFEKIFVNWFNTINMVDKNITLNEVPNLNGAIRFNTSSTQTLDYNDQMARILKILHSDGTNTIRTIENNEISYNNDKIIYNITLQISKDSLGFELLSNDMFTTYLIVNNLNLKANKIYSIKQEVVVE